MTRVRAARPPERRPSIRLRRIAAPLDRKHPMELLHHCFGTGDDLTPLQMGCRAFVTFFAALALIRIAGMRSFGKRSAFDVANGIMLGAVLSRGIVGASPWLATIAAGLVLVSLDRVLAWLGSRSGAIERLVKGETLAVFREGTMNRRAMAIAAVSRGDLQAAVRHETNSSGFEGIESIVVETTGELSVTKAKGA